MLIANYGKLTFFNVEKIKEVTDGVTIFWILTFVLMQVLVE